MNKISNQKDNDFKFNFCEREYLKHQFVQISTTLKCTNNKIIFKLEFAYV